MPQTPKTNAQYFKSSGGVAIILVIFVVALATIIVLNLTYSTFLSSRSIGMVQRQLQAEYILKSLISFSRVLISSDPTANEDSRQDGWGIFVDGHEIPAPLIGVSDPGMQISLEISGENSGLPIDALTPSGSGVNTTDTLWRKAMVRLFEKLGFDQQLADKDQTGLTNGRVFTSKELVANLIDYFDEDEDSFGGDPNSDLPQGIEASLPEGTFPKTSPTIGNLTELSIIPGFTARRIRAISPYVNFRGKRKVNINLASPLVLECLHSDIDETKAQEIVARTRGDQPFESIQQFTDDMGLNGSDMVLLASVDSDWFRVIGKVEYESQGSYFMRVSLFTDASSQGDLPEVRFPELF